MAPKIKLPPLLLIIWDDACHDDGWLDHDDYSPSGPQICHTVGYLIHRDKDAIEVCQTWSETQTGGRWRVPTGMVKKVITLKK